MGHTLHCFNLKTLSLLLCLFNKHLSPLIKLIKTNFRNMSELEADANVVLQPKLVLERVNSSENISTIPTNATDSVAEKPKSKKGRKKKSDTILSVRKVFDFFKTKSYHSHLIHIFSNALKVIQKL